MAPRLCTTRWKNKITGTETQKEPKLDLPATATDHNKGSLSFSQAFKVAGSEIINTYNKAWYERLVSTYILTRVRAM